jgi:predicted transcriptional regulator of viral defense system
MKPKATLEKIRSLITSPNFTSEEAKEFGVSAASLAYYVKTGELERLARGVYRGINAPTMDNFQWEDLVTAVRQTKNGVVCLISALVLYELTDEIPRQHWIAIPNSTRHRAPPIVRVVRMRNMNLGKTNIKIDNVTIPIFDQERTIVDAFRYLSREIAIKALKAALVKRKKEKINLEKLRRYAEALRVNISTYVLAMTTT